MTPEQLDRAQQLEAATEELKSLMRSVPSGVLSGGATRVAAWKDSMTRAKKTLDRGTKDPAKLREHIVDLRCCATASPAALAKAMYGS